MCVSHPPLATNDSPLLRAVGALLLCVSVAASLLTFPAGIPAMIAVWLGWHTVARWRGHAGWLPLVICAAVLCIKGLQLSAGMVVLFLSFAAALTIEFVSRRAGKIEPSTLRRLVYFSSTALWLAWCFLAYEWQAAAHRSQQATFERDRPVVLLGDSLIAGASPHRRAGATPAGTALSAGH